MIISEEEIRNLIRESLDKKRVNEILSLVISDIIEENNSKGVALTEDEINHLVVEKLKAARSIGSAIQSLTRTSQGDSDSPDAGSIGRTSGSNKLTSLNPNAADTFRAFINDATRNKYSIRITSAQRMPSHQWNLRFGNRRGITPAQPCRSDHQYGYAIDINFSYEKDGDKVRVNSKSSDELWKPIVDIARSHGIKWQGASDRVHFFVQGVGSLQKAKCDQFFADELGTGTPSGRSGAAIRKRWGSASMKRVEDENPAKIKGILKLAESDLRNIIKEKLKAAKSIGAGSGSVKATTSYDTSGDNKGCDGEGPITSSKYPKSAITAIEKRMDDKGITSRCTRIAILSVLAKESALKPQTEWCYTDKSNSEIRNIWSKFKSWSDTDLNELKANCELFFNTAYAGMIGNGGVESGDGYRFRGRGLVQLTGRGNYEQYGYTSNPDALNSLPAAADVAVEFITRGLSDLNFNNLEDAIKAVANVVAGSGNTEISEHSPLGRAIRMATATSKHFA